MVTVADANQCQTLAYLFSAPIDHAGRPSTPPSEPPKNDIDYMFLGALSSTSAYVSINSHFWNIYEIPKDNGEFVKTRTCKYDTVDGLYVLKGYHESSDRVKTAIERSMSEGLQDVISRVKILDINVANAALLKLRNLSKTENFLTEIKNKKTEFIGFPKPQTIHKIIETWIKERRCEGTSMTFIGDDLDDVEDDWQSQLSSVTGAHNTTWGDITFPMGIGSPNKVCLVFKINSIQLYITENHDAQLMSYEDKRPSFFKAAGRFLIAMNPIPWGRTVLRAWSRLATSARNFNCIEAAPKEDKLKIIDFPEIAD
ncbi:Protein CBG28000 [Caenorhabditis briggsae]|uniref:Protein CBG28000 n=1 Tax=Caenorhabditis briggsae TaxID=6238 RepID=B6IM61_CAEBR|nr:Protein CBG28000 [Caenorhabditis briggsae]CAS00991.1 Protein CBG28000 [Caenorhabditis briggsae]